MERSIQLSEPKHGGTMTPNGPPWALSANKQFSTRSCGRCEGLLVSDARYDLQSPAHPMAATPPYVQSGTPLSAVILQNQIRLAGERQSKQQLQHANSTRIVLLGNAA